MSFCKGCGNLVFVGAASCSNCKTEVGRRTVDNTKVAHCSICLDILKEPIKRATDGAPFCNGCWYVRPRKVSDTKKFERDISVPAAGKNLSDAVGVKVVASSAASQQHGSVNLAAKQAEATNPQTPPTDGGFSSTAAPNLSAEVDRELSKLKLAPSASVTVNPESKSVPPGTESSLSAVGSVVTAAQANGSGNLAPTSKAATTTTSAAPQTNMAAEPAGIVAFNATPNQCGKCGILNLDMYFIVPDTNQALCEACFICDECKKSIGDDGFVRENDRLLHAQCIPCDTCGRCQKPILGKYLCRSGIKIHSECFRCTTCKNELAGAPFYLKNGQELCPACSKPVA